MAYSLVQRGSPNTLEYRVYFGKDGDWMNGLGHVRYLSRSGRDHGVVNFGTYPFRYQSDLDVTFVINFGTFLDHFG